MEATSDSQDQDRSYGDEYEGEEKQINPTLTADFVSILADFGQLLNDGKEYGAQKKVVMEGCELLLAAYFTARPYEKKRVHDLDYIRDADAFVEYVEQVQTSQHETLMKLVEELSESPEPDTDADESESDSGESEGRREPTVQEVQEQLEELSADLEDLQGMSEDIEELKAKLEEVRDTSSKADGPLEEDGEPATIDHE